MKRIILHWTAGNHRVSNLDRRHYHYIVDAKGVIHNGDFPVSANIAPKQGQYAAHTLNCNTGSIGVAVAAMAGAVERPFSPGTHPITEVQLEVLYSFCADLTQEYGIPVTRETLLTHAEVQPTLKIKQRGKWDISWLPGMESPKDPILVGDMIRMGVTRAIVGKALEHPPAVVPPKKPKGFWDSVFSLFGGGR